MKCKNLILANNVENTNLHLAFFIFALYINSIKTLFIVPTDVHFIKS
jgi:hypothetical protein